jgi:ribonuclease P protein component
VPDFRFDKKRRLRQSGSFKQVLKSDFFVGRFFVIYFQPTTLGYSRLGVVASKRSLPLAIERNRFKRITRECFRKQNNISCDFVIIARRQVNLASNQDIRKCLEQHFQKLTQPCVN